MKQDPWAVVSDTPGDQWGVVGQEPAAPQVQPPVAPKKTEGFSDYFRNAADPSRGTTKIPAGVIPPLAGFGDIEIPTGLAEKIPVGGTLASAYRYYNLYKAAQRVSNDSASDEDYALLKQFGEELERDKETDKSWGYKVAEVVGQLPTFAVEFGMSGGAFGAGKKLIMEGVKKAVKKKAARIIGEKIVAPVVGSIAQTVAMPQMVAKTGAQKAVQKAVQPGVEKAQQAVAEGGDWKAELKKSMAGMDDNLALQLVKAFPDTFVEVASERTGGIATAGLSKIGKVRKLTEAVGEWWAKKGGKSVDLLNRLKESTGWNGVIGEMFEERVADVMHEINQRTGLEQKIGEDSPALVKMATGQGGRADAFKEFLEQMTVEGAAFGLPGATMGGARAVVNKAQGDKSKDQIARNLELGLNSKKLTAASLDNIVSTIEEAPLELSDKVRLLRIAAQKARAFPGRAPVADVRPEAPKPAAAIAQPPVPTIREQLGVPRQPVIPVEGPAGAAQPLPVIPGPVITPKPAPVSLLPEDTTPPVPYEQAIQQPTPATVPTLPMYPAPPATVEAPGERSAIDLNAPISDAQIRVINSIAASRSIPPAIVSRLANKPLRQLTTGESKGLMARLNTLTPQEVQALTPTPVAVPPKPVQATVPTATPAPVALVPQLQPAAKQAAKPLPFFPGDKVKTSKGNGIFLSVTSDQAGNQTVSVRIKNDIVAFPVDKVQPIEKRKGEFKVDPAKSLINAVLYEGGVNPEIVKAAGLSGEWEKIPLGIRRRITRKNSTAPIEEVAANVARHGYDVDGSNLFYLLSGEEAKRGVAVPAEGQDEQYDQLMAAYKSLQSEINELRNKPAEEPEPEPMSDEEWAQFVADRDRVEEQKGLYAAPEFTLEGEKAQKKPGAMTREEANRQFQAEKARRQAQQGSLLGAGPLFEGSAKAVSQKLQEVKATAEETGKAPKIHAPEPGKYPDLTLPKIEAMVKDVFPKAERVGGTEERPIWGEKEEVGAEPAKAEKPQTVKEVLAQPIRPSVSPEKLRALADGMNSQIQEKRNPGVAQQNVTARRARIADSMYAQADRLEKTQNKLNALADAHEAGTVPEILRSISTKAQVESLIGGSRMSTPYLHRAWIDDILKATERLPNTKEDRATLSRIRYRGDSGGNLSGNEEIQAAKRLIAKATGRGAKWSVASAKENIANYERLANIGITDEEKFQEAKKALESLGKQDVTNPVEKQIRQAEYKLLGRKIPGYFPTPKATAEKLVDAANIRSGMTVLEPSAGKGNIADTIKEKAPDTELSTIEYQNELAGILKLKGHKVVGDDFLEHRGQYDRIVMNPPFENFQDVDHVRHAYDSLRPGGRLVSVMSESPFFRSDKKAVEFRDWLDDIGGTSEKLPEKSFAEKSERATGVNARMVVIDKRAETKPKAEAPKQAALTNRAAIGRDLEERNQEENPEAPQPLQSVESIAGETAQMEVDRRALVAREAIQRVIDGKGTWGQKRKQLDLPSRMRFGKPYFDDYPIMKGEIEKAVKRELEDTIRQTGLQTTLRQEDKSIQWTLDWDQESGRDASIAKLGNLTAYVYGQGDGTRNWKVVNETTGKTEIESGDLGNYGRAKEEAEAYLRKNAQQAGSKKSAVASLFDSMENEEFDDSVSEGSSRYQAQVARDRERGLKMIVLGTDQEIIEARNALAAFRQQMDDKYDEGQQVSPEEMDRWNRLHDEVYSAEHRSQDPKFSQYVEPGGEEYVEMFVTAPNAETKMAALRKRIDDNTATQAEIEEAARLEVAGIRGGTWQDGHPDYWDIPNPVVRDRMDIHRTAKGKYLFLNEVQGPNKENQEKMPPDLRKKWREIGMEQAIQYALKYNEGRAKEDQIIGIAWTTGQQQADRYNLSKQIESVTAYNGQQSVSITATMKNGYNVIDSETYKAHELDKVVGKDLADKIRNQGYGEKTYSGLDLKVGGEGLKRLYDEDLVNVAKKFGATVEMVEMDFGREIAGKQEYSGPEFTIEQLKKFERDAQARWQGPHRTAEGWQSWNVTLEGQLADVITAMKEGTPFGEAMSDFASSSLAQALGGKMSELPKKPGAVSSFSLEPFKTLDADMEDVVREENAIPRQSRKEALQSLEVRDNVSSVRMHDRLPRKRSGASLLGLAITPAVQKGEWVDVRGKKVRGTEDVVSIGRLFRNPQFETFHILAIDDKDEVIFHEAISSRLPGTTLITKDPIGLRARYQLMNRTRRANAAKVYFFHNHPSGNVKVSKDDKRATRNWAGWVPNFGGHVIIDHETYSVVDGDGNAQEYLKLPNAEPDTIHEASIPHPGLGERLIHPLQVEKWGQDYARPDGDHVTLIYRAGETVGAVESVPVNLFMNQGEFQNWLRGRAREFGVTDVFAYYSNPKSLKKTLRVHRRMFDYTLNDTILDGFAEGIQGATRQQAPPEESNAWFRTREQVRKGTVRVREDVGEYSYWPKETERVSEPRAKYGQSENEFASHPTWQQRYAQVIAQNKAEKKLSARFDLRMFEAALPGEKLHPVLALKTPHNILERMGGKYAEISRLIFEAHVAKNATHLPGHYFGMQHFDDIANDIIKEAKIEKESEMDEMVRDLLDEAFTGLTPDKVRQSLSYNATSEERERAIKAAARLRKEIFNPIIDHIRNDPELVSVIGRKGFVNGYFPHYMKGMIDKYGQTEGTKMIRALLPERFVSKFLQERESDNWMSGVSIFDVVPSYIASTMKTIHDIPAYDKARKLIEELPLTERSWLGENAKSYAQWYISNYMGNRADILGVFDPDSFVIKLSSKIAGIYYNNLIGLNWKTYSVNTLQTVSNTIPRIGFENTVRAIHALLTDKEARRKFHESGLLFDYPGIELDFKGHIFNRVLHGGAMESLRRVLHFGMAKTEYLNRGIAYIGGLEEAKQRGLVGKAAELHAFTVVEETQFGYGPHAQPRILAVLPPDARTFQTFKMKEAEFFRNLIADAANDIRNHEDTGAVGKLSRFLFVNFFMAALLMKMGLATGRFLVDLADMMPLVGIRSYDLSKRAWNWFLAARRGIAKELLDARYDKGTRVVKPQDIPEDIITGLYDALMPAGLITKQTARDLGIIEDKRKTK